MEHSKFKLLHFALYSKGWYKKFHPKSKRKTIWDDLKCTMTADDYSGEYMTKSDIVFVILDHCNRIDKPTFKDLIQIISGIAKENCWKFGYYTIENCNWAKDRLEYLTFPEYDYWEAVVRYCMSNIANLSREELGIDSFPSPDPNVLPISNNIKQKKLTEFFKT